MKKMHLLALGSLATLGLLACPGSSVDVCDNGACDAPDGNASGADGGDGGPDVIGPPTGCDPTKAGKDAPECRVDDYAVFVKAGASGEGTKASPVGSISDGVTLAIAQKKPRIYVCEGEYGESVVIDGVVSIYGGYACDSWDASISARGRFSSRILTW